MGRTGSALDNAAIEAWHSTVEFELRAVERFATRAQARTRVSAWIDEYNRDRRHSALGIRSPISYELAHADTNSDDAVRDVGGQVPPLATGVHHVQDRVHDGRPRMLAGR